MKRNPTVLLNITPCSVSVESSCLEQSVQNRILFHTKKKKQALFSHFNFSVAPKKMQNVKTFDQVYFLDRLILYGGTNARQIF
jgi:predicted glycosyltransferase